MKWNSTIYKISNQFSLANSHTIWLEKWFWCLIRSRYHNYGVKVPIWDPELQILILKCPQKNYRNYQQKLVICLTVVWKSWVINFTQLFTVVKAAVSESQANPAFGERRHAASTIFMRNPKPNVSSFSLASWKACLNSMRKK